MKKSKKRKEKYYSNWKRITATTLIAALSVTSVSLESLAAEPAQTAENPSQTEAASGADDSVERPKELKGVTEEDSVKKENTETSTTCQIGNGKKVSVFYQEPVRYKDESGKLIDYDPSLVKVDSAKSENKESLKGYAYENEGGDAKQYFPEKLSDTTPLLMEKDGYSVALSPDMKSKAVEVEKEDFTNGYEETEEVPLTAAYDTSEPVTYAYTSGESGIKEEIRLAKCPKENTFSYTLKLKGLKLRKNPVDEGLTLYDKESDEIVGSVGAPNMNDASGKAYSEELTTKVEEAGEDTYRVTVTADWSYLKDKDRQYPVVIDPTIKWTGNTDLGDVYILSGSTYKDYNFYTSGVTVMNAGKASKGIYRTYLAFKDMKSKIKGNYVDSAILTMYETGNSTKGQTVQAYRVKEAWERSKVTWNKRPGYNTLYSTVKTTGKAKTARTLDLTSFARGLANDSIINYGVMLKGADETGKYAEFVGSRNSTTSLRPKLVVTYYDKPTKATSVSVTPSYVKPGTAIKANWAGITSKGLSYVQYKIVTLNPTTLEDVSELVPYSSSTKLGTSGSGSATIAASTGWKEGSYKIGIRGVDKGNLAGPGAGARFVIDGTAPTMAKPVLTPATTKEEPTDVQNPTIQWSGVSDANLKQMEYKIDDGAWKKLGTGTSGSVELPAGTITGNGQHKITVRAVDKAGNTKEEVLDYYYKDNTVGFDGYLPKDGTLTLRKDYGKNLISWETDKVLNDTVYYRIYRGTEKDFTPSEENMVCKKVFKGYWIDLESAKDEKWYYKVEAVRADSSGEIEEQELIDTVLSGTGTAPEEFEKHTGSQDYLGYQSFQTPTGNGTVEDQSGNLTYSQEDANLPASQLTFEMARTYNSQSLLNGMLGTGWSDTLHKELIKGEDGTMYYLDSDGSIYHFKKSGDTYVCKETKDLTLNDGSEAITNTAKSRASVKNGSISVKKKTAVCSTEMGKMKYTYKNQMESKNKSKIKGRTVKVQSSNDSAEEESEEDEDDSDDTVQRTHAYTIKDKQGILYRFNKEGQLVSALDPNGTFLLYDYLPDGRLERVSTEVKTVIELKYQKDSGLLKEIALPDATKLCYTYDNGRLTEMSHCGKDGKTLVSYAYDYDSDHLNSVTDGKGQKYTITYNGEKVSAVTYPNGEKENWGYAGGKTTVTKKASDGIEVRTNSREYDTKSGKVTKETEADGSVTTYAYEYEENPYLVTKTTKTVGYESLTNGKVEWKTKEKVSETVYDEQENEKTETDEDGTVTTYTYGDTTSEWTVDQPSEIKEEKRDTLISDEKYEYNENGESVKEEEVTDTENKTVTENAYDDSGNEIETKTTEAGIETSKTTSSYDAYGNTKESSTTSGDVVTKEENSYDVMGRVTKKNDPDTREVTEYTYDELGRQIKSVSTLNGKSQTTTSAYDANGTVVSETGTDGVKTDYVYDSLNRVVKKTVTKGTSLTYTTAYSYGDVTVQDGRGTRTIKNASIQKKSYPSGTTASETYTDASGNVVREKVNGLYTDYTYDASGNQVVAYENGTGADAAEGKVTLALFDEEGRNFATIVNPGVSGETYQVSDDSLVTKQSYDAKGNVTKETDAIGTVTAYTYDDSERVTEVMQNAGKDGAVVTKASYEADTENQKNKTTVTDAGGRKSIEVTDAAGLIKSSQDQGEKEDESIATAYSYDSRGNQTKVTYENGDYREDTCDARNLKIVSKYYQADGTQTLQTNYQYDDQYRLTKMTDAKKSGSERKAYRYTYTGYDGFGRTAWTAEVSQEAEPTDAQIAKHKISYSYDTEDKITEVTYALAEDGRVESLHYAYDKNQYLIAIKAKIKGSDEEKLIRKYRYNERGKLFTIVDFTDYRDKNESYVARFYEYDALDRVSSMTYKSGTTVLEAYTYSYDKNNNIVKKTEKNSTAKEEKDHTDQTTEYTYNALGRLTKSVVTDHKKNEEKTTTTYSYDSVGNRIKKVKGEEETAYTYNGLNQLLKAKTTKGDTVKNDISYEYDVNGNQIKETDKETGDSVENTYDVENRLSTATVTKKSGTSGNETVSLTQENLYNGDGQRIQKKEAGEVTNYFYEDGMVSYTTGADTGEKLIQNLSGLEDNVIYAERKVTGTDGTASAYQDFLYTKDIQGSTSSILNKDTKGELSYEYDDFGETSIHGSSALKNEICYTGGIYDESTGLYYLNARYYDPENGRFLTEDTYRGEVNDPDTLHLYAYCKNNPINYVDPSGHSCISSKLTLVDYWKIHKLVQLAYMFRLIGIGRGADIEVTVRNAKSMRVCGYLDVYDVTMNQYYEVKSKRQCKKNWKNVDRQLRKYDSSIIVGYSKRKHIIRNIRRGREKISGYFYYGAWRITYGLKRKGLVYYAQKLNKKRQKQLSTAKGVIKITLTAGVCIGLGMSTGNLVPAPI